jgi:hypothetical protein
MLANVKEHETAVFLLLLKWEKSEQLSGIWLKKELIQINMHVSQVWFMKIEILRYKVAIFMKI